MNNDVAIEGVLYPFETLDEAWDLSWHRPPTPPAGIRHGSNGVCVTPQGDIILVSQNGTDWDVPGGRPEGEETWEQTLRREMAEEACVTVTHAVLLGFVRAVCTKGVDSERVIVRAFWRADVVVHPWQPQFEILHRRFVRPDEVISATFWGYAPVYRRAFIEAHRA